MAKIVRVEMWMPEDSTKVMITEVHDDGWWNVYWLSFWRAAWTGLKMTFKGIDVKVVL